MSSLSALVILAFSVVVPLGITGVIVWVVWKKALAPLHAQQQEQRQLLQMGVSCAARVLHYQETGMKVSQGAQDAYRLKLFLEVMPPGMPPYQVETVSLVSVMAVPRIQPGCIVTVRYDPANPRRVALDAAYPPGQGPTAAAPPGSGYPPPPGAPYGVPPGAYGAPAAGAYGAPPGVPPGAYGAPPGAYGAPPGAYGAPPGAYGAPPGAYGAPPGAYGAPPGAYGASPGAYGAPPGVPPGAHGAPPAVVPGPVGSGPAGVPGGAPGPFGPGGGRPHGA
ncbi:uncharacterized protein SOCEGT47_031840 [Sorangium cellulosum]|uniref:DUF3592 domain-containing protein n=1 Tax=Sorangium cellulosum TaxID=56 RepID=A0A4P2Q162_SORCE|nr:hypothetical protein [Sorangium cellulosum]AUX22678.1 uncharacterized protein SOCEGT47_031840 [Sorangium cellulosum]